MIGIERMCLSCMVQGGGGSLDQATLPRASASPAARRCAGLSPSMARIVSISSAFERCSGSLSASGSGCARSF